ncbi:MAG: hypothetical protein SFV81_08480 [Pirellulaceae bacterium]|nr:hypothetical protein [Pirellulaceae bacterium]
MQQLRLMGLVLIITAIFLALAAAITQTTHIRIQTAATDSTGTNGVGNVDGPSQASNLNGGMILPPPGLGEASLGDLNSPLDSSAVQFTSVPVVWPLIIAGGVGSLLWFMLSSETPSPKQRRRLRVKG